MVAPQGIRSPEPDGELSGHGSGREDERPICAHAGGAARRARAARTIDARELALNRLHCSKVYGLSGSQNLTIVQSAGAGSRAVDGDR